MVRIAAFLKLLSYIIVDFREISNPPGQTEVGALYLHLMEKHARIRIQVER